MSGTGSGGDAQREERARDQCLEGPAAVLTGEERRRY